MKRAFAVAALPLVFVIAGLAQGAAKAETGPSGEITGLYSFLHEGEFVRIEVDEGKVSGLVSHFKNEDQDKAEFVNQSFAQGQLNGSKLSFRTKAADGVWYEFSGMVARGPAKTPAGEGYWDVKGTLSEHFANDGRTTEKVRELTLRSFPEEIEPNATE